MIEDNPDVANVSLCYEVHGTSSSIYNLVSDTCVSINAEYIQGNTSDINVVGRIGVLAVDDQTARGSQLMQSNVLVLLGRPKWYRAVCTTVQT